MTSVLVKEDGVLYEEHTFYVHRYDDDTPLALRAHFDTLGRFETLSTCVEELEERKHPELLHYEKRTEWFEIECNCGDEVDHYDDCNTVQIALHIPYKRVEA
jgi:hypothetical protein